MSTVAEATPILIQPTRQARYEERKALARNEVEIPPCKEPSRREDFLATPEAFLRGYLGERFWRPFATYHIEIMQLICDIAQHGGDQAIAAPRSGGKTEITKGIVVYLICKKLVRFPVIIGPNGVHAGLIFNDIKLHFESNDLLLADFPEICAPIRHLAGSPQRAPRQTHNGLRTRIEWTSEHVVFPRIEGSPYSGVSMKWAGMDAAIRGMNIHGERPDFVLADDLETRESAAHDGQIGTRDTILNRDVAGLSEGTRLLSRVILCTIQNHKCLSNLVTDREKRPNWNGKRYRAVITWPDREDLRDEYIELRKADQRKPERTQENRHGMTAAKFFVDNREEIERGSEILDPESFNRAKLADGRQLEVSALQSVFNTIADKGMDYVLTELQNDPREEEKPETTGLTASLVQSRISGERQGVSHRETEFTAVAVDVGKYKCHWVKIGGRGNAICNVIDYGRIEVHGTEAKTPDKAIEKAILNSLHDWRTQILADGEIDICLVDSGDYRDAVYQFVREAGLPFRAAKGLGDGQYHAVLPSPKKIVGDQWHTSLQEQYGIWLYNINVDHYKHWVHQRFVTPTFDESQIIQDGTLSLFADPMDRRRHISFAHHICAEEYREEFVAGRGLKKYWHKTNKNNHFLDATVLGCAGLNMLGLKLLGRDERAERDQAEKAAAAASQQPNKQSDVPAFTNQFGQPFLASERR